MPIIGVGVDLVDLARFDESLRRTPGLRERLFTENERALPLASLAARFAAKEAVAKALGAPRGLEWHDAEVVKDDGGRPGLRVSGTVAAAADAAGVTSWHLSLAHDGGAAVATVVAEG
jgi:holo-[acyl-carrier protein] synthase